MVSLQGCVGGELQVSLASEIKQSMVSRNPIGYPGVTGKWKDEAL